jgi:predicted metal-dependent hydrolase
MADTESDRNADREAAFQRGLDAYEQRCHFDAAEIWTEIVEKEQDEANRRFLQTIIQVSSAMHKVRHNAELRGSLHLLERALQKLDVMPDVFGPIDIATFRDATRRCLSELALLLSEARKDMDPGFIPQLKRIASGPIFEPRVMEAPTTRDKLFQEGFAAYHDGRFYDAQERWEAYRKDEPEGPARTFLRGLILVAEAMHKIHRAKSPAGAAQALELALDKLRGAPEGTCNIAVTALVQDVERMQAELERLEAAGNDEMPADQAPRIQLLSPDQPRSARDVASR